MANGLVKDMEIHEEEEGLWVEATIALSLGELIEMDIDQLNDFVEDCMFDEKRDYSMLNISYEALSVDTYDKSILVKVTADLDEWN